MELDQFLAQPPELVHDEGFSQSVALELYERRLRSRHRMLCAAAILLLAGLALSPLQLLMREIALQLTIVVASPLMPWLGGCVALLLIGLRPRWVYF